jgi:pimeloyl-ACP methyl ester carboxylesterase
LVRTFYFGCEDKSKKTLVLTHGFMANIVSYLGILKSLSQCYRVIAFDNMGWGLNTRIPAYFPECSDLEKAEAWILDFYEQTINGLDDCPE